MRTLTLIQSKYRTFSLLMLSFGSQIFFLKAPNSSLTKTVFFSMILSFKSCHVNRVIQYVIFGDCLVSHSIILWIFIQVTVSIINGNCHNRIIYGKGTNMEPEVHKRFEILPMNSQTSCKTTYTFPPHHGNQTICTFHLKRSQSGSPASIFHLYT